LIEVVKRYTGTQLSEQDSIQPIAEETSSKQLLQVARRVAETDSTVLITGESGTGKEVLAQYIHMHSPRADKPFVAINCAAIPDNMLEATLFGYEKGAFTGAVQACPGKFEQAQGGTILLDEISEMDLSLQAKLLRVLQEREVERLGSRKSIKLDVRVLATSNRDLKQYVQEGNFREDLYYRLNVFPIAWPALCDRKGDIEPLAKHLVERHCQKQGIPVPALNQDALNKLLVYPWPGNVRELDNVIQRALILSENGHISGEHILLEGLDWQDATSLQQVVENSSVVVPTVKPIAEVEPISSLASHSGLGNELRDQEYAIILETLVECGGRRKEMAEKLGISPRTLRYKLAKMRDSGIDIPN